MRPTILLLVMSNALAQAQAPPVDAPAAEEETETARATDAAVAARAYRITAGEVAGKALRLEPAPLLRWSNP